MSMDLVETEQQSKILFVDDEEDILNIYCDVLSPIANVDTATNSTEAISKLQNANYDLIIADLVMPNGNGYDLIRKKNSSPSNCNIPLILHTAYADIDVLKTFIHEGVLEYIPKPTPLDEFCDVIKVALTNIKSQKTVNEYVEIGRNITEIYHDLTTPTSTISLAAGYIKSQLTNLSSPQVQEIYEMNDIVLKSVQTISMYLQNISKNGKNNSLTIEKIEDKELFSKVRTQYFNHLISSPKLLIEKDTGTCFYADSFKIFRAIQNIINNGLQEAAKKPNGWVKFSIIQLNGCTQIRIANSGPRISFQEANLIFDPHYSSKNIDSGHKGIGLSIAKQMAELHNGRVYLDDAAEFTTFVIEIPTIYKFPI